ATRASNCPLRAGNLIELPRTDAEPRFERERRGRPTHESQRSVGTPPSRFAYVEGDSAARSGCPSHGARRRLPPSTTFGRGGDTRRRRRRRACRGVGTPNDLPEDERRSSPTKMFSQETLAKRVAANPGGPVRARVAPR